MTTYIPSLTLPEAIFANPAASILLPVGLGLGVGYSVSRMLRLWSIQTHAAEPKLNLASEADTKNI